MPQYKYGNLIGLLAGLLLGAIAFGRNTIKIRR